MKEKSVLITGISGFTGKYLKEHLAKFGYKVFGGDDLCEDKFGLKFDVKNKRLVNYTIDRIQPNFIIHLAAKSEVTNQNLKDVYLTNTLGTNNVIESAKNIKNLEKIIFASSAHVYGNHDCGLLREDFELRPNNHYAVSKLAAENICNLHADTLPIIIARPFNYTGVGQNKNFLIPKIVEGFKQNYKSLDLGSLSVARDFSDVRDIAEDYRQIMLFGIPGEVYNICSGRAISLNSIVQHLVALTGNQIIVNSKLHLIREKEVKILKGTREKLDTLTGKRQRYSIEETIEWMYVGK